MIIFADVLGHYKLPEKNCIVLYIYTLNSEVPSEHVLGMCKLPAKFYVGYIHYKARFLNMCWGCVSFQQNFMLDTYITKRGSLTCVGDV